MIAFTRAVLALLVISQLAFAADEKADVEKAAEVSANVADPAASAECPALVKIDCEDNEELVVQTNEDSGCPEFACVENFYGSQADCPVVTACAAGETTINAYDSNNCATVFCIQGE